MLLRLSLAALILLSLGIAIQPALARTILLGPNRAIQSPGQAAALVRDGDRVLFEPGIYHDCAIWTASRLTLEATRPGVLFTGTICAGRAIFVFLGHDIVVRGLTLAEAHGPYHNAAGILMEADNLTVENSRFINNENGILAGGGPASRVRVFNSDFRGNGSCLGACAHGIYAGNQISLLYVQHCLFRDTRTAHHIKSRARVTVIADSDIADGIAGTSSYLIDLPIGGEAFIHDNQLEKGPASANPATAISIGEQKDRHQPGLVIIQDNQFTNDLPTPTLFVRNQTADPVRLIRNRLTGTVSPLEGLGTIEPSPE